MFDLPVMILVAVCVWIAWRRDKREQKMLELTTAMYEALIDDTSDGGGGMTREKEGDPDPARRDIPGIHR